MFRPDVTIVIPNWNGRHLLEENLSAVRAAAEAYPGSAEVIVVDDASSDDSVEWLRSEAPYVKVVERDTNGGFSEACRSGLEAASGEPVVLLNSDIEPTPDFLAPLVAHFSQRDVFAVSCLGLREDRKTPGEGAKAPRFRRGLLKLRNFFPSEPTASFYAVGGHCAVSRRKFFELNGFDQLLRPFYWEDVDLCYRAWKRGWKTIYEPRSVVIHKHRTGTIRTSFGKRRARNINRRNCFLFVWKNITSTGMLVRKHVPLVLFRTLLGFLWLDRRFYVALFMALSLLPDALRSRWSERKKVAFDDETVFAQFQRLGPGERR